MARPLLALPTQQWYRRGRLWVAPTTGAAVAIVAGIVLLLVDQYLVTLDTPYVPKYVGSPSTAGTLLSVTATAIATLTALVLTIVTVVVQLASDKYSHRALRTFLQDRHSHVTLAMFVGTFTFAVLALLGLDGTVEDGMVVGLTVPAAFGLAVITIGIFVSYIDHIVHAARGTSIIARIGSDARDELERLYPDPFDEEATPEGVDLPDEPQTVIVAPRPGVVYEMDIAGLVEWASAADATVVIRSAVGDFIPGGTPMIDVHGDGAEHDDIGGFVRLDPERTITDDVGFGFRLLVDIAENALSPGINDPTTAVQCIDQLHDLLRRLATRTIPDGWHADAGGTLRVHVPPRRWEDYLDLACAEIRLYGEGDLQIARRLRHMLVDLYDVAPSCRHKSLDRALALLDESVERGFASAEDRAAASRPDAQGIGGGSTR